MKGFLFEYFRYTKGERNGFIVLMSICITLLTYYHFQHLLFRSDQSDLAQYEELLRSVYKEPIVAPSPVVEKPIQLEKFNPNSASESQLLNLGLSQKQVKTLLNFRNKGGKFNKPEDLLKVYGINNADFEKLKDYIELQAQKKKKDKKIVSSNPVLHPLFDFDPNTANEADFKHLGLSAKTIKTILNFRKAVPFGAASDFEKVYGLKKADYERLAPYIKIEKKAVEIKEEKKEVKWPKYEKQEWKQANVDINLASAEEWQLLRGIGPVFSKRIVKFRDKLGGFHSKEQVKETYGMTDSLYQALEPYLEISSTEAKKIDINEVSMEELKAHPYFSWKQAKVIVNYRTNHGPFKDSMDLEKTKVISKVEIEKVGPYLKF